MAKTPVSLAPSPQSRFLSLLKGDILKLDLAELDFGICRILNYRRGQVPPYLDDTLPGRIAAWTDALAQSNGGELAYAATFAQIADDDTEFFNDYARCTIVDYGYRRFHDDGFGKSRRSLVTRDSHAQDMVLSAALVAFWRQVRYFNGDATRAQRYRLATPLAVFVGQSVTGKSQDVAQVSPAGWDRMVSVIREEGGEIDLKDTLANVMQMIDSGSDTDTLGPPLPRLHVPQHLPGFSWRSAPSVLLAQDAGGDYVETLLRKVLALLPPQT